MNSSSDYRVGLAKLREKLPAPKSLIQPLSRYEQHRLRLLSSQRKRHAVHPEIGHCAIASISSRLKGINFEAISSRSSPDYSQTESEKQFQNDISDHKKLVGDGRPVIPEDIPASQGLALNDQGSLCLDKVTDLMIASYRFRKQHECDIEQVDLLEHITCRRIPVARKSSLINLKADLLRIRCKIDQVKIDMNKLQRNVGNRPLFEHI